MRRPCSGVFRNGCSRRLRTESTGSERRAMKFVVATILGLLFAATTAAHAQDAWPQRPVTIVVPFQAGGSADLVAGILQQHLQADIGKPLVVENRSGARSRRFCCPAARAPRAGRISEACPAARTAPRPAAAPPPFRCGRPRPTA